MDKSEAYKIVFDDLIQCGLFRGIYDARCGNKEYMFGIETVMGNIAYNVSEECYDKFDNMFCNNITKSEKEAGLYGEV